MVFILVITDVELVIVTPTSTNPHQSAAQSRPRHLNLALLHLPDAEPMPDMVKLIILTM